MSLPPYSPPKPNAIGNFRSPLSWGVSDMAKFTALLDEARALVTPGSYFGDNMFLWSRNNSLFDDAAFVKAWQDNAVSDADRTIAWRRYILATTAFHAVQCDGDFVECGVYQGSGMKTVMDYLGGVAFPKTFWGYDTFDYHPVPGHAFEGQVEGLFEKVQLRFSGYDQVRLIKGFIPDAFAMGVPDKVAFLHLDLNNADAEIATLESLFQKVVPGGVVIFDDYEWSGPYRSQKLAIDPWLDQRRHRAVPLPTGQALVIKH